MINEKIKELYKQHQTNPHKLPSYLIILDNNKKKTDNKHATIAYNKNTKTKSEIHTITMQIIFKITKNNLFNMEKVAHNK